MESKLLQTKDIAGPPDKTANSTWFPRFPVVRLRSRPWSTGPAILGRFDVGPISQHRK